MRHGLKAWLLLALLSPAFALAAPSYKGFAAGAYVQGPESGVFACSVNDSSPVPGAALTITCSGGDASNIASLTSPDGTLKSVDGGATATSAGWTTWALSDFVALGTAQNVEWSLSGTWVVTNVGAQTANVTMQIDPPAGAGDFFGTVTDATNAEGYCPAGVAVGDEYFADFASGTTPDFTSACSASAASDFEVDVRIWDESAAAGAGQWSAVQNSVVDSTAPTLQSTTVATNGTTVTLVFDEAVSIGAGGSGGLTLDMAGGAATLTYSSGAGTTSLVFTAGRTISVGEGGDLDFVQPGDGLQDAVGNDVASFTNATVTNNSTQDTGVPVLNSATIGTAGTSITLAFNEAVSIGAGGNGGWTISLSGGAANLTYASGAGTANLVYNISRTVGVGETGDVAYVQPGDGLEDGSGNDLASLSDFSVTNNSTQDITAPTAQDIEVPSAGTTLFITFNENVTRGAGYNAADFTATASGGALTFTYASGDGTTTHTLTTSRTVGIGETITLSWAGTANGLEDAAGNDLAAFTDRSVFNQSTQDITAPTIQSARISGTVLTWTLSESMASGAGGTGGATLTCSGGAITPTFNAIAASQITFNLSREPANDETCTTGYTQPGNGFEDSAGNDLATFSGTVVSVPADCAQLLGSVLQPVLGPAVHSLQCAY